jgi:hypothetical protein
MSPDLLEILKYIIPSFVIFITIYFLIRAFLDKEYKIRRIEYKIANQKDALPIRLQAYERMTMFLERLAFNNLLHRVRTPDMTVRDFQIALLSNIRMEYEHNVTQQIYVTGELWGMVKAVKEEVISIINRSAQTIPPNVPSQELSKKIFSYLIETEQSLPTQKALDTIKNEVMELY